MSYNKYKIFRNFMVNELGISREDIKEWTMQAVRETVEKELRGFDIKEVARLTAKSMVSNSYTSQRALEEAFKEVVTTAMKEQFHLSIKVKEA